MSLVEEVSELQAEDTLLELILGGRIEERHVLVVVIRNLTAHIVVVEREVEFHFHHVNMVVGLDDDVEPSLGSANLRVDMKAEQREDDVEHLSVVVLVETAVLIRYAFEICLERLHRRLHVVIYEPLADFPQVGCTVVECRCHVISIEVVHQPRLHLIVGESEREDF